MADDESDDKEARALLTELERLADELTVEARAQEDRFARRLAIFRRLTEKNVTQARIATAAKVTPMAVSYALGADRRRAAAGKN